MKKILYTLLFFSVGAVNAATIDFEGASFGGVNSYTEQGVTFSSQGATLSTSNGPISRTIRTNPFVSPNPFRADIAGGASAVSVDLGDFAPSDLDNIFLSVYDASDNLLATINQLCCNRVTEMITLSLVANDISYALFGGGSRRFPNSVFADNFTYEPEAVSNVPVPAAVWLFVSGLAGVMGFRKKAKLAA